MLKAAKSGPTFLSSGASGLWRGQHQQRFHCISNFLVSKLVVPVPPLPMNSDKASFSQPRQMFARRLWADMGHESQFSRRHSTTAH